MVSRIFISTAIFVGIGIGILIAAAALDIKIKQDKPILQQNQIEKGVLNTYHYTTTEGLDCVKYQQLHKRIVSISCNWEKFNKFH